MWKLSMAVAASLTLIATSFGASAVAQAEPMSDGIVSSVTKAPIVPDGGVAGALTDIVINLGSSLDPAESGRTLLAGRTIRVTLPDEFESSGLPANVPTQRAAFAGE